MNDQDQTADNVGGLISDSSRTNTAGRDGSLAGRAVPAKLFSRHGRKGSGVGRMLVSALVALVVVAILFVIPMPYVVNKPGPTFNILASTGDDVAMIEISGTDPETGGQVQLDETDEDGSQSEGAQADGQLRMVTVSESGGPGYRLNLAELIAAKLDSRNEIFNYSDVYPAEVTGDDVEQAQSYLMASSQSTAEVAALEYLGWEVPAEVTIAGAVEGSDAEGKVREGDVLRSITTPDGTSQAITSASKTFAIMAQTEPGTELGVSVERDGKPQDLRIVSQGAEGKKGSKLGLYLSFDIDMPVDVTFNLARVGGPSAGTMFALGIIDRLTPGDMTGGEVIAGTGTMSYDGQVGEIGGIRQKMWGAVRDDAQWFLAPAANCNEVVGHEPDGLSVVKVETLEDAVQAVEAIAAGKGQTLPTCQ
ncbi:YlbL family protein [Schaalia vaccimaxillae]|uniref:YlbL family protein n=1 Tax=Schaalia vaccimaxillae TaxID=183916 RepID=UPI000428E6FA|nr:S16 family serine protease [Schaalia vaccimaxillae]